MGEAYPELVAKQAQVEKALRDEEQQFARTLENGMAILEKAIANLDGRSYRAIRFLSSTIPTASPSI
jgi:alanyl-tRNA synthetase